jgi:undecaprenyl-diphosphatase
MMNSIRKNVKWIVFFISLVLFLFIAEDVFTKEIMDMDALGYGFISSFISDGATLVMKFITYFGSAYVLIPLTVLLFVLTKNKKLNILIGSNLLLVTFLNQFLKIVFQRPRPEEYRLISESGYSFPSGHSMVSMAFYGLLIYIVYRYVKNVYVKYGLMVILFMLILFIGISRIYLGVHYTSDVMGGFLLSISYLIVFIRVTDKFINCE